MRNEAPFRSLSFFGRHKLSYQHHLDFPSPAVLILSRYPVSGR
nr:MAG TPA: hypothetical protein [Caudoviricetes sp.]